MVHQNVVNEFIAMQADGRVKSLNLAAQAMGISSARLSTFLKGTYNGNVDETAVIVNNYMSLVRERESVNTDDIEFINIKNSALVLDICRLTHVQRTIALVIGRAGLGKTMALKKYAADHPDCIYIEVDTAYSSRELLSELHEICGYTGKGHLNKLKKEIIKKLVGSGRLLIIDQAEYLPDRALDLLRTIHDKAGIGIVFAGLPRLLANIRGIGGIHEQLYTRIGAAAELEKLEEQDIQALVNTYLPGAGLFKEFTEASRSNARVLYILARESKRIARNKKMNVNADIIRKASKQLIH